MKHLYSLVFVLFALTSLNLSRAQTITTINASNPGICDGSANFLDSAYFSNCTWTWYEDDTSTIIASGGQIISNLCAGDYFLVLDSTGFTQLLSFSINDTCPNITLSTSFTDCTPGNCDGIIQAFAYGGSAPYVFSFGGAPQTPLATASNLCAGTYIVTCMDAFGCTTSITATIADTSLSTISPNLTIDDSTASCSGSASLAPTGGSGSYTYLWSTGETTNFVYMLCPGNHWVSIYDGTDTLTFNFSIYNACGGFSGTYTSTLASGPGICDGSVTFTPYGGTPPYSFSWNNGANTQTISNACPGTYYTATAMDIYGCMTSPIVIVTGNPIAVNLTTTGDLTGNCVGEAYVAPTGGLGPYSYLWSTGETTSAIGNLCVGNYSVIVWDNTDTVTTNFIITNPCTNFTGSFTTSPSINGTCTGTATFNVSGGLPPYYYSWDNGASFNPGPTAANLCPGIWDLVCIDSNGCTINQPITISDSTIIINLLANLTLTDDLTNNCSGSASVSPNGGIAPYTVLWSDGSTASSVSNLCAGIYSVTIWDSGIDSTTVNFVIADSSSTYNNNPYPNGPINDSLYTDLVTNCIIDYNAIDSASLYQAVYSSSTQSLYVTWAVYSPTDTVYISDTLALIGNPGYYTLTVSVYCPNKSGNDFFKIESVIYFDGSNVWMSTLGINEQDLLNNISVYPNPFSNSISVDNKDGIIQSIKLIDLNGRVLFEMSQINSELVELNQLESVSSGTYLLILSGESSSKAYKVIK